MTTNPRELKDSSDDENSQTVLLSPQSKYSNKTAHLDESSATAGEVSVDYWTIIDQQKEKKDGLRTIKSSLKSNIRVLTITRQAMMNSDGKISPSLTMTFVTGEKKQKSKKINEKFDWISIGIVLVMKFGKKFRDFQTNKLLEPQAITGINRLVCTSKSQNVDLKGTIIPKSLSSSILIMYFQFISMDKNGIMSNSFKSPLNGIRISNISL